MIPTIKEWAEQAEEAIDEQWEDEAPAILAALPVGPRDRDIPAPSHYVGAKNPMKMGKSSGKASVAKGTSAKAATRGPTSKAGRSKAWAKSRGKRTPIQVDR